MGYTDKENIAISQISYMNLEQYYDKARAQKGGGNVTLKEIRDMAKASKDDYLVGKMDALAEQIKDDKWLNWSIAGIHNKNDSPSGNGFYACIIETSKGNAAVGFRGSESMDSYFNVKTDWTEADLKLLNSTLTKQQNECDIFMQKYADQLKQYDNLGMCGHSLGGNLAEYSTIVSHRYGLDKNIKQCMSLDGPGFSDEFIKLHKDEIEKMAPVMKHRRWSFVGTMLNDLPGVDYMFCKVEKHSGLKYAVERHDTKYVILNGDSFEEGEQDWLSKITSKLSKGLDHLPAPIGNAVVTVISSVWSGAMWIKENVVDKMSDFQKGFFAGVATAIAVPLLIMNLPVLAHMVVIAVVVTAAVILFEYAYEFVEKAIKFLAEKVGQIYKWVKDKVVKFVKFCADIAKGIKNWIDKNFNAGYKYASNNPVVAFDTYKLTSLADRLYAVNQRLKTLDSRMDGLYKKLSAGDKLRLQKADVEIGSNKFLTKSAEYLKGVVSIYEEAEREINSKLNG